MNKRKIFSRSTSRWLMLAVLALTATTAGAQDFEHCLHADGFYYQFNPDGETVYITAADRWHGPKDNQHWGHCHCYSGDVVVPETINGHKVTGLGKECFISCAITSVTLPSTVSFINEYAFHHCSQVPSVTIPASVDTIGYGAFNDMAALAEVTIEDSPHVLCFGGGGWTTSSGTFTQDNILRKVYIGRDYRHPVYKSGGYDCGAFVRHPTLEEVTFGDLVTVVPQNAFYLSKALKRVHLGAAIQRIDEDAFYGCDSLTTVNLPEGLTTIGDGAFYDCFMLTDVTLPSTLTFIDRNAFAYCKSIEHITIPASVDSIATGAFNSCEGLASLTIEDTPNVLRMASGGYYTSSSMFSEQPIKTLYIGRPYRHNYGGRADYRNHAFSNSKSIETVVVSDHLTEIYQNMFANDPALKTVTLGKNITTIGEDAFIHCDSLTTINLPEGLTTIGDAAFYQCLSLPAIKLPSTLTFIDRNAFADCKSLASISIPAAVDSIGTSAFNGCAALASLTLEDTPNVLRMASGGTSTSSSMFSDQPIKSVYIGRPYTHAGRSDYNNHAFSNSRTIETVVINDNLTEVYQNMFYNDPALKSVTLGKNIATIGKEAFNRCSALQTVNLPEGLTTIGAWAFGSCKSLPEVTFPSTLKLIDNNAFHYCDSLASVIIPASVDSIADAAFASCGGVKTYIIEDSPNTIHLGGGFNSRSLDIFRSLETFYLGRNFTCPFDWYSTAFYDHPTLREATIGGYATEVTESMFTRCKKLEKVTLGPRVTAIRKAAFNACSSLTTVDDPENIETIEQDAFYNCTSLQAIPSLAKVRIVSKDAFYGCESIPSLTIPATVDSIGSGAFYGWKAAEEIVIEDGDTELKLGSSNMFNAYNRAESLKKLYVGRDFWADGGSNLVYNCASIEDVVYGDRVTRINEYELRGCTSLKHVTMGAGMKTIGNNAFYEDTALETLTVNATVPPTFTNGDPFYYRLDKDQVTLRVPEASLPAYQQADVWKDFYHIESGIDAIGHSPLAIDHCYSLGGHRLSAPQRGLNIVRSEDGTVRKVFVK